MYMVMLTIIFQEIKTIEVALKAQVVPEDKARTNSKTERTR